jgi:hypothetical protein
MSTRIEKAEAMQRAIAEVVMYMDCEGLNINNLPKELESNPVSANSAKVQIEKIRNAIAEKSDSSELQEIINVVNNVVTTTTNGTSSVQNLEDLKAFLNQAIPAWQNAMLNQTVFQQQYYQFPPRT